MQIAKKAKEKEKKHAEANGRKKLGNVRVIQRNLVYVTNLALSAATEEILKRDYFGRFGKIKKVVVNRNNVYQGPQGPSVCAYITYFRGKDAQDAIKAVDGTVLDGRLLRASFGTTKYCSYFLRNVRCPNPDCMYLHELGADVDSFTKEDMAQGKHLLSNVSADRDDDDEYIDDDDGSNTGTPRRGDLSPRPKPRQQVAWKTVSVGSPVSEHSTPLQSSLNPEEWPDPLSVQNKGISKKFKPGTPHGSYTLSSSPRPEGGRSGGSADSSQDDELSDSGDSPQDHRSMHQQNSWGSQEEFEEHGKPREAENRHTTTNGVHRNNYYTTSNHNTPDMETGPKQRKNHLTPKKQTEWRKIQTKPQNSMIASSLPSEASALGSSPSPISVGDAGLAASAPTSSTPMGSSGSRDSSGPMGDGDDKENHTIDKLNITMDILRSPEKASRPRNIVAPKPYVADDFLADYRLTEPLANGNHGGNLAWGNHSNKLSAPMEIPHDTDERSPREVWGDHVIPGRSDMVQSPEPAYSSAFRNNRTQVPNQLQVNHMAEFGETPELPGFDDWLRVKFTDLLLDESSHQNGKSAEISPESIWNENLVIFSSSPAGKSRFNFARDEGTDDSDRENHVNESPNSLPNSFIEFRSSANITIQQPLHHTPRGQLQMNSNHHVKRAPNHNNFNHVIDEEQTVDGMFPHNMYNHKQRVLQPKQQQHRQQSLAQQPNNQLFHSYEFGVGMNNSASWSPAPAPTHVPGPSMYVQTPTKPTHKSIPTLQNNIPTHPSLSHQQTHVHSPSKTPRSTWGQPTGHEHPNGTNANMSSNNNGYWNNTVPAHAHTYTHKSAPYTQNDAHKATLTGLEKY